MRHYERKRLPLWFHAPSALRHITAYAQRSWNPFMRHENQKGVNATIAEYCERKFKP